MEPRAKTPIADPMYLSRVVLSDAVDSEQAAPQNAKIVVSIMPLFKHQQLSRNFPKGIYLLTIPQPLQCSSAYLEVLGLLLKLS